MHASAHYVAIFGILFLCLRLRTILFELQFKKGIGAATNEQLARSVMASVSFSEYVPLSLILIFFVEMLGAHYYFVHLLGFLLLSSRFLHFYGISQINQKTIVYKLGTAINMLVIVTSSLSIVRLIPSI